MTATKLYDWDEQKLDVSVPQVSAARPLTQTPDDVAVTVDEQGRVSLGEEMMSLDELKSRLRKAHENYADQGVVIRADGRTTHQKVADVMSACHAAGIVHIIFSVREIPTSGSK
jgi:biopolymer transport protein ExbD